MDSIRTLLLARTHTVVLDPDRVASAATRPTRDVDLEKFEDELAQLGYVMSLDLAMTVRRLPHQALAELRAWIVSTLSRSLGTHRPDLPLFRGIPTGGAALSIRATACSPSCFCWSWDSFATATAYGLLGSREGPDTVMTRGSTTLWTRQAPIARLAQSSRDLDESALVQVSSRMPAGVIALVCGLFLLDAREVP